MKRFVILIVTASICSGFISSRWNLAEGIDNLEVFPVNGGTGSGSRSSGNEPLFFSLSWGLLEFPGEIITDTEDYPITGAEDAVVIGTRNSDWTRGKVYFYDWLGNLTGSISRVYFGATGDLPVTR